MSEELEKAVDALMKRYQWRLHEGTVQVLAHKNQTYTWLAIASTAYLHQDGREEQTFAVMAVGQDAQVLPLEAIPAMLSWSENVVREMYHGTL